jgi:hypothetical protein
MSDPTELELELIPVQPTEPSYDFTDFTIEQTLLRSIRLREKLTELTTLMSQEILTEIPHSHTESLRLTQEINSLLESSLI